MLLYAPVFVCHVHRGLAITERGLGLRVFDEAAAEDLSRHHLGVRPGGIDTDRY